MADNVTIDNGGLTDFVVSADEAASGLVQRVKLAYSGDGVDTHVTADAGGLLVNLGANNDVVASGTVTIGGGTAYVGGTASVNVVGGTATWTLAAGTAVVGKVQVANSTATADLLTLTSGTALAVGIYDSTGAQVALSSPIAISSTPSIDAGAYVANDNLDGDIISFANAVATTGGIAHLIGVELQDKSDLAPDLSIFFLRASITPESQNAAFTMTDANAEKIVAVVHTASGTWEDYVNGRKMFLVPSPPKPIRCDATTLYAVVRVNASWTPTSTSDLIITPILLR